MTATQILLVPTRDTIAEEIKRDIISGALNLGQKIPEADYARQFGVSRTPVRESVLSLSTLGLVTVKAKSGSYVVTFTEDSLRELFETRFLLEASSVRYATATDRKKLVKKLISLNKRMSQLKSNTDEFLDFHDADTLFHRALVETSNNDRLARIYEPVEICALAARSRLSRTGNLANDAIGHHRQIITHLKVDDIGGFELALRNHLNWVHEMLASIVVR